MKHHAPVWGGEFVFNKVIKMINTCPIDNFLFGLWVIVKLGILLKLVNLLNTEVIKQIVININNKDWYNAKKLWILNVLKVKINRTIIDLWQIIIYIIKYLF